MSQKNFIFIHSTSSFTVDIKYWAGGLRKGIYLFKFSFQCQHFPAIFPNNKKEKDRMMKCQKNERVFFSNCSLLDLFFRVVDGSNSVVKHDKKDKRHVKKSRKGGFFIIGQFLFSGTTKCLGSKELV